MLFFAALCFTSSKYIKLFAKGKIFHMFIVQKCLMYRSVNFKYSSTEFCI